MRIGVPRERRAGETRVAATPETIRKLVKAGHEVLVEREAGVAADIPDTAYEEAGASLVDGNAAFGADLVVKVRAPLDEELAQMRAGSVLLGMLNPFDADGLDKMAKAGIQPLRWRPHRAPPVPRVWTYCRRRRTSPATRPCWWRPIFTSASSR